MLTDAMRKKIDGLSYADMLKLVRFAPIGHPYFVKGEVGDYFRAHMNSEREKISDGEAVAISKDLGWG